MKQPHPLTPCLLIHPFAPNGKTGISAERGGKKGYTVQEVDAASRDKMRQLLFQIAVAHDTESGNTWVRPWATLEEKVPKWQLVQGT